MERYLFNRGLKRLIGSMLSISFFHAASSPLKAEERTTIPFLQISPMVMAMLMPSIWSAWPVSALRLPLGISTNSHTVTGSPSRGKINN